MSFSGVALGDLKTPLEIVDRAVNARGVEVAKLGRGLFAASPFGAAVFVGPRLDFSKNWLLGGWVQGGLAVGYTREGGAEVDADDYFVGGGGGGGGCHFVVLMRYRFA